MENNRGRVVVVVQLLRQIQRQNRCEFKKIITKLTFLYIFNYEPLTE